MTARRPMIVASVCFALALLALAGTLVQTALVVSDAQAQSSVRPPGDAVNVQSTPGGSVRPPATQPSDAPAAPGEPRPLELQDAVNPAKADPPLATQGPNSASTIWGQIREGDTFTSSLPDPNAAFLVQDEGIGWLEWRAKGGPLQLYGGWAMLGVIVLLVLFFVLRGRIRIDAGRSGRTIERFKAVERFGHWLLAVSFILLAVSGLNLLYGKDYLLPILGKDAFATVTLAGKWIHNNLAWGFMAAIALTFVLWVAHNIPGKTDLVWLAKGGGLFVEGVHPPARKFNAGQKLIFWSVILLGVSISLSGISLLFPYEAPMFAGTFAILNDLGVGPLVWGGPLPTELTPIQEMQYAQIWHTIVAFAMIVIIIAHIYIGSVGMEGAFSAMGSGHVDRNWAREHHGLWVAEEEVEGRIPPERPGTAATPAE